MAIFYMRICHDNLHIYVHILGRLAEICKAFVRFLFNNFRKSFPKNSRKIKYEKNVWLFILKKNFINIRCKTMLL